PSTADPVHVQGRDANPNILVVVAILGLEPPADRVHFAARFCEGDAWFEEAVDVEIIAVADGTRIDTRAEHVRGDAESGRNPKLAVAVRLIIWRHHADHGVRL